MLLKATRTLVWMATIEDRPGGLAHLLEPLAKVQTNLDFVIAKHKSADPSQGMLYVAPIEGQKQVTAARDAGFAPRDNVFSVRVEGPDEIGVAYRITRALGAAHVNVYGLSAARVGDRCVLYLAFVNDVDAEKAVKLINAL